jgi:hypothetical protein
MPIRIRILRLLDLNRRRLWRKRDRLSLSRRGLVLLARTHMMRYMFVLLITVHLITCVIIYRQSFFRLCHLHRKRCHRRHSHLNRRLKPPRLPRPTCGIRGTSRTSFQSIALARGGMRSGQHPLQKRDGRSNGIGMHPHLFEIRVQFSEIANGCLLGR